MNSVSSSSDILDWQLSFAGFLLQPAPNNEVLQRWLTITPACQTRLKVYRNNVLYSLTEALSAQFPVVQRLVGEEFFRALARDYVFNNPPREPALTFYGDLMPDFIFQHQHCQPLPFLADVARLDYCCQQVLHAAESPALDPAILVSLEPDLLLQMSLPLLPAVKLLQSSWPLHRIRDSKFDNADVEIHLDSSDTTALLVYRSNDRVLVTNLALPLFSFLEALKKKFSLIDAWNQVQHKFDLPDQELTALLSQSLLLPIFAIPGLPASASRVQQPDNN